MSVARKLFSQTIQHSLVCLRRENAFINPVVRLLKNNDGWGLLRLGRYYCKNPSGFCWQCRRVTEKTQIFFCCDCGKLQEANKHIDYFDLMAMKKTFHVDSIKLTQKFRHLQSLLHPDKYTNKDNMEQANSLEWSSLVNEAYKTLTVPLDRGEYMLKLQGVEIPEDNTVLDKEFLLEIMELNEEVEVADNDNITKIADRVQRELESLAEELGQNINVTKLDSAKFILIRMKYLQTVQKKIKENALKLGVVI